MKYFIIHGDAYYALEIEEYQTKQEAVDRLTFLKDNHSDYCVYVIKGERMGIISSWDIKEEI